MCPASAKVEVDPITKYEQSKFVTQGTEGHGIPTVCFVSGIIGGALGGVLIYWCKSPVLIAYELSYTLVPIYVRVAVIAGTIIINKNFLLSSKGLIQNKALL